MLESIIHHHFLVFSQIHTHQEIFCSVKLVELCRTRIQVNGTGLLSVPPFTSTECKAPHNITNEVLRL